MATREQPVSERPDEPENTGETAAPYAEPDVPGAEPAAGYLARIQEEHRRYRAAVDLYVGGALAVRPNGAVPASHPMLREWLAEGMVIDRDTLPAED